MRMLVTVHPDWLWNWQKNTVHGCIFFICPRRRELALLFKSGIPLQDKKITAEVCIHHLMFDDNQTILPGATSLNGIRPLNQQDDKECTFQGP